MSTSIHQPQIASYTRESIFRRILVGIDDSPESLEAARQAAALATGPVTLLAAFDVTPLVTGAGMAPVPPIHLDETPARERAERALEVANEKLGQRETIAKTVTGRAWDELLYEIRYKDNTLVAVGSHGAGRAKGMLLGSTATEILHKAPCSVLVARTPLKEFPSSIVVGVDDSPQGVTAAAVARDLAERFDAQLERCENVSYPVEFLAATAIGADLLVVGSRRLHGLRALVSVSERVAHEAKCSVLVVR